MDPSEAARHLLREQYGLATIAQLLGTGITRRELQSRLGRSWRVVLPRVVATFTGALDLRQRFVAAQLYADPDAMITGVSAARWHGVGAAVSATVQIEVPHNRRPRGESFVEIRRTRRPDPYPWVRGPLLLVSRQRAVATAARDSGTVTEATAIVTEGVQRGIVRIEDLRHELEAGPRSGSAVLRRALAAAEAHQWSVPEAELARVLERSKILPPAMFNPDLSTAEGLRLPRPDAWLDDVALAIQVHSYRYHALPDAWDSTVMTDGVLVEHGVVVLAVTPRAIRGHPVDLLGRVERAYEHARRRPRPTVIAVADGVRGLSA